MATEDERDDIEAVKASLMLGGWHVLLWPNAEAYLAVALLVDASWCMDAVESCLCGMIEHATGVHPHDEPDIYGAFVGRGAMDTMRTEGVSALLSQVAEVIVEGEAAEALAVLRRVTPR